MFEPIRFGDFLREMSVRHNNISYNKLTPEPEKDENGKPKPSAPQKLELRTMDVYRLLQPYVGSRFKEQLVAVVPIALLMSAFQYFVLGQPVNNALMIGGGLLAVMVGLMFFMEGLKLGLMPFGETIGNTLPKKATLPVVLLIAFLLGILVTFAEPAISSLQLAGSNIDPLKAPYLYALLTKYSFPLVMVVGVGVGLAAVLGTLRFIYGWSMKPFIYCSLIPTLTLTAFAFMNPDLRSIIGLAWDCGAVTTGPVTVPLVLSLGIGVAAAVGQGSSALSGFGIVTLASLFPIIGVLCLGFFVSFTTPVDVVTAAAVEAKALAAQAIPQWYEKTPGQEVVLGVRAIAPLVAFLFGVLMLVLKERLKQAGTVVYGITLAVIGMVIFNFGLTYGLSALGDQTGGTIPGAFMEVSGLVGSPYFSYIAGVSWALIFALVIGFAATLAEPALNALGMTVQNLTNGAFKKSMLMYSVAGGVALGIAIGTSKIIFDFQLAYLLIPGYCFAMIMTYLSSEEYVNIAWDSAGVTTGPVTVPLVLAMGLGFGKGVGALEGFGILASASLFPILAVMSTGLYVQYKTNKLKSKQEQSNDMEAAA